MSTTEIDQYEAAPTRQQVAASDLGRAAQALDHLGENLSHVWVVKPMSHPGESAVMIEAEQVQAFTAPLAALLRARAADIDKGLLWEHELEHELTVARAITAEVQR